MENLLLFLATNLLGLSSSRFKRYLLNTSRCSALLVGSQPRLYCKRTKDGDKVCFYEQALGKVTYGLITVHMKNCYTLFEAENLLVQYMNNVRSPFHINYNTGMQIEKAETIISITDYWQDETGMDWKVKSYSNGKTIGFLYVKNITESNVQEHDAFLGGFKFSPLP